MKYDISYMTTEAVSLLKSLISIPSISPVSYTHLTLPTTMLV